MDSAEIFSFIGGVSGLIAVIGAAALWGRYRKAVDIVESNVKNIMDDRVRCRREHADCREKLKDDIEGRLQMLDEREDRHYQDARVSNHKLRDDLHPFVVTMTAQITALKQKVDDLLPVIVGRMDELTMRLDSVINGDGKAQ